MAGNLELISRYGMRTEEFSALMKRRVRDILLVASRYDAFILEEDGQLTELMFEEYRQLDLNLRYAPRFVRADSARHALTLLGERDFDLVVVTPRLPDMKIDAFVQEVRSARPEVPIGLLAAHAWDLPWLEELRGSGDLNWLFLWQGDVKALLAMIKQEEDRQNADHDILEGGVQAIILVEDDVRFYSSYLPHIYTEVTTQTSRLMAEGINLSHRLLRIRARPKILLAQTYEQALELYERYAANLLGVISDLSYPRNGEMDPRAGLRLARAIRELHPDIPILLQSIDREHRSEAATVGASFLDKSSHQLIADLRQYILDHFGFGDFVFKLRDGTEAGRAHDMRGLLRLLGTVPDECLVYHAARNHFSAWLKARTEFELASLLRPRTVSEFSSIGDLRSYLISTLTTYLREIQRHVITDFDRHTFDEFVAFAKIGSGSLGGKGRGLAFMHKLLASERLDMPPVEVSIPQTLVLASDVFEEFLAANDLRSLVREAPGLADGEILDAFRGGRFTRELRGQLASFLNTVTGPVAIRSSSILEDSVYQPFAGVYATVMLPNSHSSLDVRLAQLLEAIKVVYASTYFEQARGYLETTPYRIEEERMAVLLQRLVGSRRGDLYYPTLAGTASSYNFYPFRPMQPEHGMVQVALGLGKSVVEGFEALRFCPRQPQVLPQFSAVKDVLRNAQRRFYGLDMSRDDVIPGLELDANLVHADITRAFDDGSAVPVASTYLRANDTITPGIVDGGAPLVTFAHILRGRVLPLPEIMTRLLEACQQGISSPVEIEFAADITDERDPAQTLHILQLRPLVVETMTSDVELDAELLRRAVVRSESALGHGRSDVLSDVILIDPTRLERSETPRVAMAIDAINRRLRAEGRSSILIGPGRWGSRDPWLGIPVSWAQISSARAIVETDFGDLQVEPSLGSHFFHNLTCFGIAFFAVHGHSNGGFIDWDWLHRQEAASEDLGGVVRHLRLQGGARVLVDGASGRGVIVSDGS